MNAGLVDLFGDYGEDEGYEDMSPQKRLAEAAVAAASKGHRQSDEENISKNLPPEIERGNIEYKLKLIDPSPVRFEHLVTQMKWRLQEGLGEAIYEIGVSDDGFLKVSISFSLFLIFSHLVLQSSFNTNFIKIS